MRNLRVREREGHSSFPDMFRFDPQHVRVVILDIIDKYSGKKIF